MVKQTPSRRSSNNDLETLKDKKVLGAAVGSNDARRRDLRIHSALPVSVNGVMGTTRDISASGVFFEIDENSNEPGSTIQFSVRLETPGGAINLVCEGQVIRMEKRDGKLGIAANIISQTMESA